MITRLLTSAIGPWILGAIALITAAGWTAAGLQTIRYQTARADLEETRAQVAEELNTANTAVVEALRAAHAKALAELQERLMAQQQAEARARAESARLASQLGQFQRDVEKLHDEPEIRTYLSQPFPGALRERLRQAQRSN